ncbi:MAG: glycosyltransferase family 25 protein [Gammaproteobacteria bacterium]
MTDKLPPVYVISLARAKERRENMTRRLNALGANYQIIDAVDGKALNPSQYAHRLQTREYFLKFGCQLTAGEIGCFMSHHNLWRQIADGKDDCALIVEDDATWDDDFAEVITRTIKCDWHWEVVFFSVQKPRPADCILCEVGKGRQLIRYKRRDWCTTIAYLISRQGAAKLLDYCQNIRAPIDRMYAEYWRNGVAFYCVRPPVVRESGETTTISGRDGKIKRTITEQIYGSIYRKADRIRQAIYLLANRPQKKITPYPPQQ